MSSNLLPATISRARLEKFRVAALLWLTAVWLASGAAPARAAAVLADLSSHIIAIGGGFTGDSVVLFGSTDGPGDIIAVIRGPERDATVWRKAKVAGIWINADAVTFSNIPAFYSVVASRPLEQLIQPSVAALYKIGTAHLRYEAVSPVSPEHARLFAGALIEQQQRAGLFVADIGRVRFLGERLFRATLTFPENVPTGTYLVQVFLVRDGDVVSGQTTPLVVSKVGVDAAISDFAIRQSAAYGVIAIVVALAAGWLASLPFRRA
ncbi:MAG: TIGR02186 family protein [Alphaproteobacteria bacterium]